MSSVAFPTSYRMLYALPSKDYRFRLSCCYHHLLCAYLLVHLSAHFAIAEGSAALPASSSCALKVAAYTMIALSDTISVLYTTLILFFLRYSDNILTPLKNQPITFDRVWKNIYIHYVPGILLRLLQFDDSSSVLTEVGVKKAALLFSTALTLLWVIACWNIFDKTYGVVYKKSRLKGETVRDLLLPWCLTAGLAHIVMRVRYYSIE